MKTFSLDDALSGKPVKLRNGSKAYVIGCVPDGIESVYPLRGFVVELKPTGGVTDGTAASWTLSGNNYTHTDSHPTDIIGMWEEPTKYRHINGHKFPEPCSEPLEEGQSYYTIDFDVGVEIGHSRWVNDKYDNTRLKQGVIHTTQEAAQAHADAVNSIFRGEPCPY